MWHLRLTRFIINKLLEYLQTTPSPKEGEKKIIPTPRKNGNDNCNFNYNKQYEREEEKNQKKEKNQMSDFKVSTKNITIGNTMRSPGKRNVETLRLIDCLIFFSCLFYPLDLIARLSKFNDEGKNKEYCRRNINSCIFIVYFDADK